MPNKNDKTIRKSNAMSSKNVASKVAEMQATNNGGSGSLISTLNPKAPIFVPGSKFHITAKSLLQPSDPDPQPADGEENEEEQEEYFPTSSSSNDPLSLDITEASAAISSSQLEPFTTAERHQALRGLVNIRVNQQQRKSSSETTTPPNAAEGENDPNPPGSEPTTSTSTCAPKEETEEEPTRLPSLSPLPSPLPSPASSFENISPTEATHSARNAKPDPKGHAHYPHLQPEAAPPRKRVSHSDDSDDSDFSSWRSYDFVKADPHSARNAKADPKGDYGDLEEAENGGKGKGKGKVRRWFGGR